MGDSPQEGEDIEIPLCIQQPELSGKWYLNDIPEKGIYECVRECSGRSPCNGRASFNNKLYDTYDECCKDRTWWIGCSPVTGRHGLPLHEGAEPSKCSDTFWDTYHEWDKVGYYPVCKLFCKL